MIGDTMKIASAEKARPVSVTIKLDDADRGRIAALASAKKRSPHYLMKEAILAYVKHEEARQNLIAAAEASFVHYKETGLHITLDEMSAWVDEVQKNPAAALPECHT
jgi:predicted transcriptional regulator